MVDIWRELNPTCRDFTHFSSPHQTYARIDHILIPTNLIPFSSKAKIIDIVWSDHLLVLLTIKNVLSRSGGSYWRLNESLLGDPVHAKMIADAIKEYFRINDVGNISPETLWAAHKVTVRGELIRLATQVKKERLIDIHRLEQKCITLKIDHKKHPSRELNEKLDAIRLELNLALTAKAEKHIRWSVAKFYCHRDKVGMMLATKLSPKFHSHFPQITYSRPTTNGQPI